MKHFSRITVLALLSFSLVLASCTKEDDENTNNSPSATTPTFVDGAGVLVALKTVTYVSASGFVIPTELNSGVALFSDTPGSQVLADAGTVTLNGAALKKYENNSYIYDNLLSPISLETIQWEVSGKGNVPAISKQITRDMPDYSGYNDLPATISKSSGLTINLSGEVSNADSVYVVLIDMNSKFLLKRAAGNASSVSISASELDGFKNGMAYLQVVPWNYSSETISGKKIYFVNETVCSKTDVTIQ